MHTSPVCTVHVADVFSLMRRFKSIIPCILRSILAVLL